MTRLLARFTVPVFVLLMGLMTLLRVQSYDDHGLRELLLPENCTAPCFMGIRLGVTTVEEAIRILEQHQWVDNVDIDEAGISWTWSGEQPTIIDSFYNGILGTDQQQAAQVADSILIRVHARLGDLQSVFGYSRRYYNHKLFDQAWCGWIAWRWCLMPTGSWLSPRLTALNIARTSGTPGHC